MSGTRYGVVLAGGRSTRFGKRDKAVTPLVGTPMVRRVADRLAGVTDRLVLNCRADQRAAMADVMDDYPNPLRYAEDPDPGAGPTAGIRAGLRAVADWGGPDALAAVVACDMPFVDPAFVAYLFERAAGTDAALAEFDGWYQTTQAVYRAGPVADACAAVLARGEAKVLAAVFDVDHVVVTEAEALARTDARTFENVNTEAEFEAAADAFGGTE